MAPSSNSDWLQFPLIRIVQNVSWLHHIFERRAVESWSSPMSSSSTVANASLSENHYNCAQAIAAWLLVTLVAVNGGALTTEIGRQHPLPFVCGVITAFLSGFASWQEAQDRTGLHYIESLPDHAITDHGRKLFSRWRWRWSALQLAARVLNWGSLELFAVGCGLSAQALPA